MEMYTRNFNFLFKVESDYFYLKINSTVKNKNRARLVTISISGCFRPTYSRFCLENLVLMTVPYCSKMDLFVRQEWVDLIFL